MHFSSQLLNEAVLAACWTLVHSLWQGLMLVILTGLVLVSTRTSRPVVRYRLLSALMLLFAVGAAATFAREWDTQVVRRVVAQAPVHEPVAGAVGDVVPVTRGEVAVAPAGQGAPDLVPVIGSGLLMAERVSGFLSEHAVSIVLIWLAILGLRLGRVCWVIAYTRHIRRHESQPLPEYWAGRVKEMSERLGLRRPVLLLESAVMKIPVVFGHLKPVIFIPLGLFSKLSPEQVEAILLHELAHIKRDDYLMNLLQSITVHLFFFNPAVLWLSALVREEREHCCDEMAIAGTGDKKPLVRALIGFRELSLGSAAVYGMGFTGRRNVFVNRIARIVRGKSKGLTAGEGVFFGLSVLLVGLLAMAFKQGGRPESVKGHKVAVASSLAAGTIADTTALVESLERDTLPNKAGDAEQRDRLVSLDVDLAHGKQVIVAWYEGRLYHITQVNGVVTRLNVGDKPVPPDDLGSYSSTIKRIYEKIDQVRIANEDPQLDGDNFGAGSPFNDRDRVQELLQHKEDLDIAKVKLLQQLGDLQATRLASKGDWEKQLAELENGQKQGKVELEKLLDESSHSQDLLKNDMAKKLAEMSVSRDMADSELTKQLAQLQNLQDNLDPQTKEILEEQQIALKRLQKDMLRDNTKLRAIMDAVVKRGIVDDIKQIHSLSLTKDALIVNGKRQPDEVRKAFLKEFVPDPEKEIHYGFSNK